MRVDPVPVASAPVQCTLAVYKAALTPTIRQGSTGSGFYSLGRKWEGNNQLFWCGKEMGRKKVILSVWEGNGKEIMRLVGMGGKW